MFTRLKVKLTLLFTLIVAILQIINALIFIMYKNAGHAMTSPVVVSDIVWMLWEVLITSLLTYIIGYVFVSLTVKPAETMFERLEQFAQDASHELKTPLTIANSSIDLALKTQEYAKYLHEAKGSLMRVNTLVDSLLMLARIDTYSLMKESFSVEEAVDDILESFQSQLTSDHIEVKKSIRDSCMIQADRDLFLILVSNLVSNAIKFNKSNGTIKIRMNHKALSISNSGQPIPHDKLEQVFDRFYKTDASRTRKGHGIGLSVVKKICDLHGWKIKAESSQGETTFTLTFR